MIAGWQRTGFPADPRPRVVRRGRAVGAGRATRLWWAGSAWRRTSGRRRRGRLRASRRLRRVPAHRGRATSTSLPDDFPLAVAALIEPLAVCVRALRPPATGTAPVGADLRRRADRAADAAAAEGRGRRARRAGRRTRRRLDLAREFGAAATLNYHEAGPTWPRPWPRLPGAPFPTSSRPADRRRPCFGKKVSPERLGMRKATKKASAIFYLFPKNKPAPYPGRSAGCG